MLQGGGDDFLTGKSKKAIARFPKAVSYIDVDEEVAAKIVLLKASLDSR